MAFLAGRYTAQTPLPGLDPAPPPPRVTTVSLNPKQLQETRVALKDCRDQCEQTAILTASRDVQLKACRTRCDADHELPEVPRETPRSITVAPADHRP